MMPPNPKKRKRSPSREASQARNQQNQVLPASKRLHLDATTDILKFLDDQTEIPLPRLRPKKEPVSRLWRPHTVAQ